MTSPILNPVLSAATYNVYLVHPLLPDGSPDTTGKLVPDGIIADTCRRDGLAYGHYLPTPQAHVPYIMAKIIEELTETATALRTGHTNHLKLAGEIADLITACRLAQYHYGPGDDESLTPLLEELRGQAQQLQANLRRFGYEEAARAIATLASRTLVFANTFMVGNSFGITKHDIDFARATKIERFGHFGGWTLYAMALQRADPLGARLLEEGWHHLHPNAEGRFPAFRIDAALTYDQLAVTRPRG